MRAPNHRHSLKFVAVIKDLVLSKIRDCSRSNSIFLLIVLGIQVLYAFQDQDGIQGNLALQQSHNSTILAVDFASQSSFFVTAAKDSKVKVWQSDGQLIRTIDVGFSPYHIKVINEDQHLFIVGHLGEVKICNIEGTKWLDLSRNFSKTLATTSDFDVTPNGGVFVLGSTKGINVFNAKGEELISLTMPSMKPTKRKVYNASSNGVHKLAISPNGKILAATNYYGELAVWHLDGRLILHEKLTEAVITSMTFNNEGQLAMSLGLPAGRQVKETQQELGVYIVNFQSKGEITEIKSPPLKKVVFSKDGKRLLGLSQVQNEKQVFIWNTDGKLVNKFFVEDGSYGAADLTMSSDGELIAVNNLQFDPSGIQLWSTNGELVKNIRTKFDGINALVATNDLNIVATGLHANQVRLWSLYGKLLATLNTGSLVHSMALDTNGNKLIVGTQDNIQVWDLKSKSRLQTIEGVRGGAYQLTVNDEGDFFIAVGTHEQLMTFSFKNGKYVLEDCTDVPGIQSASLSPQKNRIIVGLHRGQLKAIDLSGNTIWEKTVKPEKSANGRIKPIGTISSINYNASGEYIAALGEFKTVILNKKGEELALLSAGSRSNRGDITFMDNDSLLLMGSQKYIELWNWKQNSRIAKYTGHTAHVNALTYIPNTTLMLSGSRDGQLRLWNLTTGYSASIASKDGKWIIYDDLGFFDASRDGGEILNFSKGIKTYSAEQFALYFNRPDVIFSKLGITSQDYNDHLLELYKNRISKAIIKEQYLSSKIGVPEVSILSSEKKQNQIEIEFNINDSESQLSRYQIYLNGSPIYGAQGKMIEGENLTIRESIDLVNGENYIEITAFNELGGESSRVAVKESHELKMPSKVYFVGMGVSEYNNEDMNLKYAAKDANDMAQVLYEKYLGKATFKQLLLTDEKVTKSVLPEIKKFIGEATVHDKVILFIAGHGGYEKKSSGEYYYVVHDTDISSLKKTAISWADLEELLYATKANKKVLLMDTCESGELDAANRLEAMEIARKNGFYSRARDLYKGLENKERSKREYLYFKDRYIYNDLMKGSGAAVFSSSHGGEVSFESDKLKNGFFTAALISGLTDESDKSDVDKDGNVSLNELVDFVSIRVGSQTQGMQNPTVDRGNARIELQF